MQFKIDENLEIVAREQCDLLPPKKTTEIAVELCAKFIDAGMIEMAPANFNVPVLQATGPQYVSDVCAVLAEYLYNDETKSIPADVFDAFCKLVIISDGCPHCGGELKFVETEGHEIKDGDYYTPNSYVIDKYVYRCAECGEIVKTVKEL